MSWLLILSFAAEVVALVFIVDCVMLPIFEAWYEVKEAPRIDMYVCDKHGPIPKHLCLVFEEKEDKSDQTEQQYQCPMCYEDAFKAAAAKFKDKERVRV